MKETVMGRHADGPEKTKGKGYSTEAHLIYGQMDDPRWDYSHHLLPPISSSATFRLDSARRGAQGFAEFAHSSDEVTVEAKAPIYIYDRLGEPNKDMLEENLALAEHGDIAVTFASGMAAISGVLGILTGAGRLSRTKRSTDAPTPFSRIGIPGSRSRRSSWTFRMLRMSGVRLQKTRGCCTWNLPRIPRCA
jgi:hypothetical protein